MKHIITISFGLFIGISSTFASDTKVISLEDCLREARIHYPLYKNSKILDEALRLSISQLDFGWIPRLKLNGQATYQSDVTSLPFDSSVIRSQFGISYTPLEKDQYKINVEITQPIFDAGNIMTQKQVTRAQTDTRKAELENDLYKVQQSVKDVYFTILLLDLQLKQNDIHTQELNKNYKNLQNRYNLGVALSDDLDKINIEILSAERSKFDLEAQKNIAISTLRELTALDIEHLSLEIPDMEATLAYLKYAKVHFLANDNAIFDNRPEVKYFAYKSEELELQKKVELSKSLPYIDAFFQGGYGYPGLNILKSGFNLYYTAGLRFSWEFGNLYSKKQQDELIATRKLEINHTKEEFFLQSKISLIELINKAYSILNQLEKYDSSVNLSQKILDSSEAKMLNGVISTNDLITDINNLNLIKLERNYQQIDFFNQVYQIKQVLNNWNIQR